MNRNEFIKTTLFSGLMIGGLKIYPYNKPNEDYNTIGNWSVPTIDYFLRGISRGCFYYVFFDSFIKQEEISQKFNLMKFPGITSNDIYFHINSFLRKFMSKLERINDNGDIIFTKFSEEQQKVKSLLKNAGFTNDDIENYNNGISYPKSICDSYVEINKKLAAGYKKTLSGNKALIYFFDYCKYRDYEPRELMHFLRDDEQIPMHIIHFRLTDVTIQYLEAAGSTFEIPHISARVDFCTPGYLGFHSKIHYNILKDEIIDKEEI